MVIELNRIENKLPLRRSICRKGSFLLSDRYFSMYMHLHRRREPNLTIGKSCSRSQPFFKLSIITYRAESFTSHVTRMTRNQSTCFPNQNKDKYLPWEMMPNRHNSRFFIKIVSRVNYVDTLCFQ